MLIFGRFQANFCPKINIHEVLKINKINIRKLQGIDISPACSLYRTRRRSFEPVLPVLNHARGRRLHLRRLADDRA
jgi:hypothetical protein